MEDRKTSFLIDLKSPFLLETKFSPDIRANNNRLITDASDQLDRLINAGLLGGGNFLVITGVCSLPVSYLIATRLGHVYGAIAINDPKLAEPTKPRYVIAISHSPDYHLGDISELNDDKLKIISHIIEVKKPTATFSIELEEDILQIDFNQLEPASNDLIVRDADNRLTQLISDKILTAGELLKINGPASLPVGYAIAHKVCHLFKTIAIFDPKMAKYVVVKTSSPKYALGQMLS